MIDRFLVIQKEQINVLLSFEFVLVRLVNDAFFEILCHVLVIHDEPLFMMTVLRLCDIVLVNILRLWLTVQKQQFMLIVILL